MSPIEGISELRKLPRLGKIKLGIKKEGQKGPYPSATDYFVCPEEVKAIYNEKPTELKIMFPADELELVAPQWYKCYSYTQGRICKGDGRTCIRKVDTDTGDFADKTTKHWEVVKGTCKPDDCPMLAQKQCRKVMSLFFILPDVPGLGVYQLDTSSFYSIVNINSQLAKGDDRLGIPEGFLRQFTRGRISFIPLILSVGPQVVNPPGEGRKTVHVLNVRADVKLADIIRISRQAPARVLLPTVEDEEPPEELYPDEVIGGPDAESEAEQIRKEVKAPRVPTTCCCPKPVPSQEVGMKPDGSYWHVKCDGYICTPPIDCYPGCPHIPLEPTEVSDESAAIVGEGFTLDLNWLNESQKSLKWTDEMMLSFITSHYKVSGKTVTEALNKLTRDQAEDFTREINARLERQPKLI